MLVQPLRQQNQILVEEYRNILSNAENLTMSPITAEIAESAAQIRAKYDIRTPDALQIATALAINCQFFLTNDEHLKKVSEIQVRTLKDMLEWNRLF